MNRTSPFTQLDELVSKANAHDDMPSDADWERMASHLQASINAAHPTTSALPNPNSGALATTAAKGLVVTAGFLGAVASILALLFLGPGASGPSQETLEARHPEAYGTMAGVQPTDKLWSPVILAGPPTEVASAEPQQRDRVRLKSVVTHRRVAPSGLHQAHSTPAPISSEPVVQAQLAPEPLLQSEKGARPSTAVDSLAAGLRRLQQAEVALRAGRASTVEALLSSPIDYRLAPQVSALRAMAFCMSKRTKRGQEMMQAHLRQNPKSPYKSQLLRVCQTPNR